MNGTRFTTSRSHFSSMFFDKLKICFSLFALFFSLLTLYNPSLIFPLVLFTTLNTTYTGWLLTCTILILSIYSLKKRFLIMRFGTLAVWYDFHIYFGLITLFLLLIHSNFLVGTGLSLIVIFSTYIVMVTGIYGMWIQMVVPDILLREEAENMDYKKIIEKEESLKRKIRLLEGTTQKIRVLFSKYTKKKCNELSAFFNPLITGKHSVSDDEQMTLISMLSEYEKSEYLILIKTINDRKLIHRQLKLIRLMNTWLYFHIASVSTLLVLITIHIFSYYYY